jgi:hypothetical protein
MNNQILTTTPETPNIIIHIDWSGPHTFEDVAKLNGPTDFGIYQIYGAHHIYGSDVLLYIGQAAGQTFAQRIPDHAEWVWGSPDPKRISCYLGRLFDYETPDDQE